MGIAAHRVQALRATELPLPARSSPRPLPLPVLARRRSTPQSICPHETVGPGATTDGGPTGGRNTSRGNHSTTLEAFAMSELGFPLMENSKTLPKTPIGSLHIEFKRCGRPNCRCCRGLLHGPYIYRHWREGSRQQKAYVPMGRLGEVLLEIEELRAAAAGPREVTQVLKEHRHG